jgi:hypothetical protein
MNVVVRGVLGLVACGALGVGCASSAGEESDLELADLGTLDQPLCENKGGTNAVMTAIAVAAGQEMKRWLPERDFQWNTAKGMLELSPYAFPRCADRQCRNTQALLDMQKPEANGKVVFPGNIKLDSNLLKSQLKTNWNAQASCNSSGACAAPNHDLRYTHLENGSCDKKFFFDPLAMGTNNRLSVADADKLKNKLKFLGYPGNKMLNFYIREGQVSVDPTWGLNEAPGVSSGSCEAVCTKFSLADASGRCCSCNGSTKKLVRSAFSAVVYTCS